MATVHQTTVSSATRTAGRGLFTRLFGPKAGYRFSSALERGPAADLRDVMIAGLSAADAQRMTRI